MSNRESSDVFGTFCTFVKDCLSSPATGACDVSVHPSSFDKCVVVIKWSDIKYVFADTIDKHATHMKTRDNMRAVSYCVRHAFECVNAFVIRNKEDIR